MNTYKVFCNKIALYPNIATLTGITGATRRFVGWAELNGEWVPRTEPETIPACAEYARALRQGELIPADKATADAVGIPFKQ